MAETLEPGVSANEVARRHGVPASRVSSWRTLARLVLRAPEEPEEFAAFMLGPVKEPPTFFAQPMAESVVGRHVAPQL